MQDLLCVAIATTMSFNVIFSLTVIGWPSLALSQAGFLLHPLNRYWLSGAGGHSLGTVENLIDQASPCPQRPVEGQQLGRADQRVAWGSRFQTVGNP